MYFFFHMCVHVIEQKWSHDRPGSCSVPHPAAYRTPCINFVCHNTPFAPNSTEILCHARAPAELLLMLPLRWIIRASALIAVVVALQILSLNAFCQQVIWIEALVIMMAVLVSASYASMRARKIPMHGFMEY